MRNIIGNNAEEVGAITAMKKKNCLGKEKHMLFFPSASLPLTSRIFGIRNIMRTLSTNFMVLQFLGVWAPTKCSSLFTLILYKLYSYTLIGSLFVHLATCIIGLMLTGRSLLEIANYGCRSIAGLIAFGKMLNVIISRETIIGIVKTLETDPCVPRDEHEIAIQNEHKRNIRNICLQYIMVINLTIVTLIVHTALYTVPAKQLPRRAWFPFDYSHGVFYWSTLIFQIVMLPYLYLITFGYNTLVWGMFLEISTKLTILQYRFINIHEKSLKKLEDNTHEYADIAKIETDLIIDCVNCHLCLFDLAKRVNSTFSLIIFLQYLISIAVLCLSIYNISGMKFDIGFVYYVIYLGIMLIEIFLYCDCANEVTIQSESICLSVFAADWPNFAKTTLKSILIIGCQACRPIVFTSGYFVVLSLDSFKSIIKVTYSAFNAMQSF